MFKYSNCSYDFCIYNDNKKSILDDISINGEGCCADIVLPNIPKEILDHYKLKTLKELEKNGKENKTPPIKGHTSTLSKRKLNRT